MGYFGQHPLLKWVFSVAKVHIWLAQSPPLMDASMIAPLPTE
jgi:hypothetical protein